jgi:predicted nucleic acid-binding protein
LREIRYLLDTSVYSQRLKKNPNENVIRWWKDQGDACISISAFCEGELLYGLNKRKSERLWIEYHRFLENRLIVLPVDKSVSEIYGTLRVENEGYGRSLGDMDLFIAATALHHQLQLATLNVKHFAGIPGLRLVEFG